MGMLKLTKSKIKVSIHSCPLLNNIEKMALLFNFFYFLFFSPKLHRYFKKEDRTKFISSVGKKS